MEITEAMRQAPCPNILLASKQIYYEARGLYLVATGDYLANTPFEHSKLDDYQLLVRLAILPSHVCAWTND